MKENQDKELYNKSICIYCKHRNECNQNIFTVKIFKDRISLYCVKYDRGNPIISIADEYIIY